LIFVKPRFDAYKAISLQCPLRNSDGRAQLWDIKRSTGIFLCCLAKQAHDQQMVAPNRRVLADLADAEALEIIMSDGRIGSE